MSQLIGKQETSLYQLRAVRKGRSQSPCILALGIIERATSDKCFTIRALDQSYKPTLVALLSPLEVKQMGQALIQASTCQTHSQTTSQTLVGTTNCQHA